VPVAEHVHVDRALPARADPAVLLEQERAGVVERRDPGARHDARLQRRAAVDIVERPGRAAEVRHRLAVAPHRPVVADVAAHLDAEAGGGERPAIVGQPQALGDELEHRLAVDDVEVGHRKVAVKRERRRAILEHAVGGPLEPHEAGRQHRDAPAVALYDGLRSGHGRHGQPQVPAQRCHPYAGLWHTASMLLPSGSST
jgi:hypothetical protein